MQINRGGHPDHARTVKISDFQIVADSRIIKYTIHPAHLFRPDNDLTLMDLGQSGHSGAIKSVFVGSGG